LHNRNYFEQINKIICYNNNNLILLFLLEFYIIINYLFENCEKNLYISLKLCDIALLRIIQRKFFRLMCSGGLWVYENSSSQHTYLKLYDV
jgi:hypothetical protein